MPRIATIIATKNRPDFLKKAVASVKRQTHPSDFFIVVSDSNEENLPLDRAAVGSGAIFLTDRYAHNYAGNLNTALDYLLSLELQRVPYSIDDLYVAFLDDDDVWHDDYLQQCFALLTPTTDLVVPLIHYLAEGKDFILDLPGHLDEKSFLAVNPHIQGSNTFIRLKLLLKAGAFDEAQDSTTDRDFFTRVFLLHPEVVYYPHPLVDVDAFDSRPRLSNDPLGKAKSFANFYSKYYGLMDEATEAGFFQRVLRYSHLKKEDIPSLLSQEEPVPFTPLTIKRHLKRRFVIGFIASDPLLARRLLQDIVSQRLNDYRIVVFVNGDFPLQLPCRLRSHLREVSLVSIRRELNRIPCADYLRPSVLKGKQITDIAASRIILHYCLKKYSKDGDIIWVLDDDMRLAGLTRRKGTFVSIPLSLEAVSSHYLGQADVVVGSYNGDAPLPSLATLRTSLLDYVYANRLHKQDYYQSFPYLRRDYYYDLAEDHRCLETPLPWPKEASLDALFSGQATSRPLFSSNAEDFSAYCRGGNTIIYNRKALDVPNISPVFDQLIARRSDYFWVEQLRQGGFKVIGAPYGTLHSRPLKESFSFVTESEKALKDLLGSSFTKAREAMGEETRVAFADSFTGFMGDRLVRSVDSFYRVLGLLEIIGDPHYSSYLTESDIVAFIRQCRPYFDRNLLYSAFDYVKSLENHYLAGKKVEALEAYVDQAGWNYGLLGYGQEGAVFATKEGTFKIFYHDFDSSLLERYGADFENCPELYPVSLVRVGPYKALRYSSNNWVKSYEGGHAQELANLIRFLRKRNLVITNIKRENFILDGKQLKFIDYGKDMVTLTPELYEEEVKRAYEMLKYPGLSIPEYKHLISLSHQGKDQSFCFGIEAFKRLIELRGKEAIHDPLILSLVNKYHPDSILDFGAGKCKLINAIPASVKAVYDRDKETVTAHAGPDVRIIEKIAKETGPFDLALCNLVLCECQPEEAVAAVREISRLLSPNGHAIISVCNPFFSNIARTETRYSGNDDHYWHNRFYFKVTPYSTKAEVHHPYSFYQALFARQGLEITAVHETDGVDVSHLDDISEHLVFECAKTPITVLDDCTLLIKVCPMDADIAEACIRQIVSQLGQGIRFKDVMVAVDYNVPPSRARAYHPDDARKLRVALYHLSGEGYIDHIYTVKGAKERETTYRSYFEQDAPNLYSAKGQPLLAELLAINAVKTHYVFQSDVDVVYFGNHHGEFLEAYQAFKKSRAVTASLGILHHEDAAPSLGDRTEVRSCFLDRYAFSYHAPFNNPIVNDTFTLGWHRCLDAVTSPKERLRFHQSGLGFLHLPNTMKADANAVSMVLTAALEDLPIPEEQYDQVDLQGSEKEWSPHCEASLVVFSRGRDVSPTATRRLANSLASQTDQDFVWVYIDDASSPNQGASEYFRAIAKLPAFQSHLIYRQNLLPVGSLANFDRAIHNIVLNPDAIIVNVDGDDALLTPKALARIRQAFSDGADLSVGNCFRVDKPLRHYIVESFEKPYLREGDNIWLHPKCFRKYLCGYLGDFLKQADGSYIDVATDYAMMLPLVEAAKHPAFIDEPLYYFAPSKANTQKQEQYRAEHRTEIRAGLLAKAQRRFMKPIVAIIGDSNVPKEDPRYQAAFALGQALVDAGYRVQSGGMSGVMLAAFEGAHASKNYSFGDTIAILPGRDEEEANPFADIKVATGFDHRRAEEVVSASAVIAIGGGSGTLEEIAVAWETFRLLLAYKGVEGWSGKLADTRIDPRIRYPEIPEDKVYGIASPQEAIELIQRYAEKYTREYHGIAPRKK